MRDLRCFDGGLVSERCDDDLKEPESATKNVEARRMIFPLAGNSGRVLVTIREAMGSSKRQCTSRATYIQFRLSEMIDARKRSTETKKLS